MTNREQIRLELVKALLTVDTSRVLSTTSFKPVPVEKPGLYPGLRERVDALEAIIFGSSTEPDLVAGERVECRCPGSWTDGRVGTVEAANVVSTDGIRGYRVRVDGQDGYTILPRDQLAPLA